MDPMDAIRATFFEECGELMETLEAELLVLEAGRQDADTVDAIFRAVHSIKGGAGAFDLGPLVGYAHLFESALAALRAGRLALDADVTSVLLRACDRLGDLVVASQAIGPVAAPDGTDLTQLLERADAATTPRPSPGPGASTMPPLDLSDEDAEEAKPTKAAVAAAWTIDFEPLPDLLGSGNEPLFLFRALEVLGTIAVVAVDDDLPSLEEMDVRVPRLRWRIRLAPSAPDLTETEIESVFEFALNLCALEVRPETEATRVPPEGAGPSMGPAPSRTGREPAAAAPRPEPAPAPAAPGRAPLPTSIRVDLGRVDRLVNLVGELVISQSMLAQGMSRAGLDQHSDAVSRLDELQQLTRDMQDSVMAIRAQPVKSLFQRMTRIVREAAQMTGKDVVLEIDGEGTEIDKTVVERLADPLTHMIRNAVDHGLEDAATRVAGGKPAAGVVRLSARQRSDRVVIEVADDGRGIDRPRVLARAVARGLVPQGRVLDDAEIDRLLFLPGFSTSPTVSAISGRGVGLDVVLRAIRDLSGSISVRSVEGEGCAISISLPLTLAILDGMIVRSRNQRMVVPLSAILETQTIDAARIETVAGARRVVRLHDRFVPLVDLAQGMGFDRSPDRDDDDTALVFVQSDDVPPFALRVDGIEAQRQVVIKGLGDNFGHVPCVSAATILGDGQVALIVDPAGIARMAGLHRATPTTATPEMMAQ